MKRSQRENKSAASVPPLSVHGQAECNPTFLVLLDSWRLVRCDAVGDFFIDDQLAVFHAFGADNLAAIMATVDSAPFIHVGAGA